MVVLDRHDLCQGVCASVIDARRQQIPSTDRQSTLIPAINMKMLLKMHTAPERTVPRSDRVWVFCQMISIRTRNEL